MRAFLLLCAVMSCRKEQTGDTPERRLAPVPVSADAMAADADVRSTDLGPCKPDEPELSAIEACEASCTSGKAAACVAASTMFYGGVGARMDRERSQLLALRACELGAADGCARAVPMISDAARRDATERRASSLAQHDCEAGDGHACGELAWWYKGMLGPLSTMRDESRSAQYEAKSRDLLAKACDEGSALGCAELGLALTAEHTDRKSVERGRQLILRACQQGHASSCYQAGTDVDDEKQQRDLAERACSLGFGRACHYIADVFADELTKQSWFERGCTLRYGPSCRRLGSAAREHGLHARAQAMFERACQLGDTMACAESAN